MDRLESKIRGGEEADRVLNSPVFAQAFEDVRLSLITALELIPTTQAGDDQAKDVRRKLAALSSVHKALSIRIDTGKLALRELSLIEKAATAGKRLVKNLHNVRGNR